MNKYTSVSPVVRLVPEMKIFELIEADYSLLSIFDRLDIVLPFGDMSLRELCHRDGYSDHLFLELCRMHVELNYRPAVEQLTEDMLPQLLRYLRASHHYYEGYLLPHTMMHLDEVLAHCDELSQLTLRRFYTDYVDFVRNHLNEEERDVFAIIEQSKLPEDDLESLQMPHGDIDDRTSDIASLIIKYLPEQAPIKLRYAMLKDIYVLRDDLRRHANVELYLLKPLVDRFIR